MKCGFLLFCAAKLRKLKSLLVQCVLCSNMIGRYIYATVFFVLFSGCVDFPHSFFISPHVQLLPQVLNHFSIKLKLKSPEAVGRTAAATARRKLQGNGRFLFLWLIFQQQKQKLPTTPLELGQKKQSVSGSMLKKPSEVRWPTGLYTGQHRSLHSVGIKDRSASDSRNNVIIEGSFNFQIDLWPVSKYC